MFERVDNTGHPAEILLGCVNAAARQEKIAVIAGNAFEHPEQSSVNFMRVVEWTQHSRPDAFNVPEVKELMGDGRQELPVVRLGDEIVFTDGDVSRIQVLDTVGCLGLDLEQKQVFLVGKP